MLKNKSVLIFAAASGGLAVALGAFGAHGLQQLADAGKIDAEDIRTYEVAVRYQFYHTLALLILPAIKDLLSQKFLRYAANAFVAGIIIFSGSLYLLVSSQFVLSEKATWLGAITPLGGLLFIGGWIFILLAAIKRGKQA